jgi:hypothetical protein
MDTETMHELAGYAMDVYAVGSAHDLVKALNQVEDGNADLVAAHANLLDAAQENIQQWIFDGMVAEWKEKLISPLMTRPDADSLREYIEVAEDMDGAEYWLQFNTPEEVLTDLKLYEEMSNED